MYLQLGLRKYSPVAPSRITITVMMGSRSQMYPQQRDEESTTVIDKRDDGSDLSVAVESNLATATPPHHRPAMVPQKSSIHSRMMTHFTGGRANASISECLFVVITGQLLAFNAGYINGACLSGWLMKNGRKQAVASLTGAYTGSALLLVDGNVTDFGFQVCMILSFTFGAFLSGLLTPKATPYRIEPTYGPTFCLGGLILLGSSLLAAFHSNSTSMSAHWADFVFYLAAMANGIQNGMSSIYSGNLIRSTHLTGTSTDIGIFAGQLVRGNTQNNWKLLVLVALALSFWVGGVVSFYATQHFTSSSLLFNAVLFIGVGAMLVAFLVHEHSISVVQAIMGTWQWKRALHKLSSHIDNAAADEMGNTSESSHWFSNCTTKKDRLLALFHIVDADDSGNIAPDELINALLATGYTVCMKDIQAMIKYADKDGDGEISLEEWRLIVNEICKK